MDTNEAFVIERIYPVTVDRVWNAITNREEMKRWYFDLPDFKPEPGVEFQFMGGPTEDRQYKHICKITEVIAGKKIAHSWRYEGYAGDTVVTFELFDEDSKTRLKLTHEGLESFPPDNPDFAKTNFAEGWTMIIGTSLKEYLEKAVH